MYSKAEIDRLAKFKARQAQAQPLAQPENIPQENQNAN
jgi:hypothetical protein